MPTVADVLLSSLLSGTVLSGSTTAVLAMLPAQGAAGASGVDHDRGIGPLVDCTAVARNGYGRAGASSRRRSACRIGGDEAHARRQRINHPDTGGVGGSGVVDRQLVAHRPRLHDAGRAGLADAEVGQGGAAAVLHAASGRWPCL